MEDLLTIKKILGKYEKKNQELEIHYKEQKENLKKQLIEWLEEEESKKLKELDYLRYIRNIYEKNDKEGISRITEILNGNQTSFYKNIEENNIIPLKEERDGEGINESGNQKDDGKGEGGGEGGIQGM